MKNTYQGSVTLVCQSCRSNDIYVSDNKSLARCNNCQREYAGGYDELVKLNQSRIDVGVEKMKNEILSDAQKDLEKMMKDAFKGSKFLKLK